MTLSSGSRLGPYEVLAPLGAGGMGECTGRGTRGLREPVAIKVLPSHLSANPEVRQRFEREAKTISSLSHPRIRGLYDVGHQDGTDYFSIYLRRTLQEGGHLEGKPEVTLASGSRLGPYEIRRRAGRKVSRPATADHW